MNEYDHIEDLPKTYINLSKGDRDLDLTIPADISAYDIMDAFVGMLISAGYEQSHIEHWIADKYGSKYNNR